MPKSKHRKNHKQKVNARKVNVQNESTRVRNAQKEFIMDLIKKEQEKGLLDNNPDFPTSVPHLSGPMIGGEVTDQLSVALSGAEPSEITEVNEPIK